MNFFNTIGKTIFHWIGVFVDSLELIMETCYWIFIGSFRKKSINWTAVFEQMVFMGIQSIIIVFFVMLFTGVVLAMQSAPQLTKMGAVFYVASLVSISICRELGPVLTA